MSIIERSIKDEANANWLISIRTKKFKNNISKVIKNEIDTESRGLLATQQGALQNAIVGIEGRLTNTIINSITNAKNAFDEQSDVISEKEKRDYEKELELALETFYSIIFPLYAASILNRRAREFGDFANFKMNSNVKRYIREIAKKSSESHINTIIDDFLSVIKETYEANLKEAIDVIEATGRKVTDADLMFAREQALTGKSQTKIVNEIKKKYSQVTTNRAKTIARTETNRAFTQSQYQADIQFIKQNGYESRAFKKWVTTSDNPCPTCLDLASRPPIPFTENFANLGDEIITTYEVDGKTKVKTNLVNFEPLSAGNAHVNCGCKYLLIIE